MPVSSRHFAARRRLFPLLIAVVGGVMIGLASTTAATAAVVPSTAASVLVDSGVPALSDAATTARDRLTAAEDALDDARATNQAVAASGLDVADAKVDTTELQTTIDQLSGTAFTPILLLPQLSDTAAEVTDATAARVDAVRGSLTEARDVLAAEEAAAEAQRQAEAAAEAARIEAERQAELARVNTPDGARAVAARIAADEYGWGSDQFSCLSSLWQKESGWDYQAYNAGSGATGIPQALPGSKMASVGSDWQSNAETQIRWGLQYINGSYGSPCAAWGKSQSSGWY